MSPPFPPSLVVSELNETSIRRMRNILAFGPWHHKSPRFEERASSFLSISHGSLSRQEAILLQPLSNVCGILQRHLILVIACVY